MALQYLHNLVTLRMHEGDNDTNYTVLHEKSSTSDLEDQSSSTTDLLDTENHGASEQKPRLDTRLISDATIGLSDGLTVPFALSAGLSALGDARIVIIGGLAELIAGAISMGMGGYLGAKSEAEAFTATQISTKQMDHLKTEHLIRETISDLDIPQDLHGPLTTHLSSDPTNATQFLMRFHHCLDSQALSSSCRAYISALTISTGYFVGGLIPLVPYLFASTVKEGLMWSVAVMAIALFAFGYGKSKLAAEAGWRNAVKGGVQMAVLGGLAAGAAAGCVWVASFYDMVPG
ncbi:MAG: hypothetical protein M1831_002092 [Alyxoria varia]|nr:MAG: hypothetical protein M1831_002092 [Alyxoria varia]